MSDPYRIIDDEPDWLFSWGGYKARRKRQSTVRYEPPKGAFEDSGYLLPPEAHRRLREIQQFHRQVGWETKFIEDPVEREKYVKQTLELNQKLCHLERMITNYPSITNKALALALGIDLRVIAKCRHKLKHGETQ